MFCSDVLVRLVVVPPVECFVMADLEGLLVRIVVQKHLSGVDPLLHERVGFVLGWLDLITYFLRDDSRAYVLEFVHSDQVDSVEVVLLKCHSWGLACVSAVY